MPLSKEQKEKALKALKEKIAKQKAIFFVDFTGLKMKDMSDLRKKVRGIDGELKAAKKSLIGIAFKDSKIEIDVKNMPGEVALVLGYKDEVAPARTVWQFSQTNKNLKILGGFMGNKLMLAGDVVTLAQLPSREELLAKIVGSIQAPVSNFVYALNYNIKGLVVALNAIKDNKQ
jgi:large subunit ribosomal protein L10